MSLYELALLGGATPDQTQRLTQTITNMVEEFGLKVGQDLVIYTAADVCARSSRTAFAAAYFGSQPHQDEILAQELIAKSLPVIPVLGLDGDFGLHIPGFLQSANGLRLRPDDEDLTEAAAALLECVGLMRRQRRVFVSYRRIESRAAAVQLHDLLTSRGFDVFLDTHDIRPGEPFQEVLWHRLVDSDVMVMLDTPTYFGSKWTRQEIGRARAKEIQVLRVIWPDHNPNQLTSLSETLYLQQGDLDGPEGPIRAEVADDIVLKVERLRSLSIAARYMSITGKLRADVEKIGASIEAIGAHRAIAVRLIDNSVLWAYPVVGVPTAETFNDIANMARQADQQGAPVLVYDEIGLRQSWNSHLSWLQEHIKAVRAIKVSRAAWELAGWDEAV